MVSRVLVRKLVIKRGDRTQDGCWITQPVPAPALPQNFMKKSLCLFAVVLASFGFGVLTGARFLIQHGRIDAVESADSGQVVSSVSVPRTHGPVFAPSNSGITLPDKSTGSAGAEPTTDERAVMKELGRRARSGEYILPTDNPFVVRMQQEKLKQAIESIGPSIVTSRANFLTNLGVSPNTMAKLTNHAARIAEASFAVDPLLGMVGMAKIEYDLKARELLTSEQYDRFKEFEIRQALEQEWKGYGVEGLEQSLPFNDVTSVTQSLEDLGIRHIFPSTYLPYQADPSSDAVTGEEAKARIPGQMSKLEYAAKALDALAEQKRLSEEAKQVVASIIQNRSRSLQQELDDIIRGEAEHTARLRAMMERKSTQRSSPPPAPR